MSKLLLKTERLSVRDFRADDWAQIVRRTTQAEVARFMPWDTRAWAEKERVLEWIREQRTYDFSVTDRYLEFAIVKDGLNIGDVAIKRLSRDPTLAEVGWTLEPAFQGRGYATEAVSALMDWGFRNLCVRRIISVCDARNTASYRLMERLGMRREAHHLKSSFIKGEWVDDLVYAVLKAEWLSHPPPPYTVQLPLSVLETEESV